MKNLKVKDITTLSLFLTLGLILPYVTSHSVGIPGIILLPMHIPVLVIGFLYGPKIGCFFGVMIPILSFLFTGMPTTIMLPIMVVELALYGFASGLFYKVLKLNVYISLILSMVLGRVGYAFVLYILANVFYLESMSSVLSVSGAIVTGIPGICIQIVLIPILVRFLKEYVK